MLDEPIAAAVDAEEAALQSPAIRALVRQMRAHDTHGAWEKKSDAEVLKPFIVTKAERRAIPVVGDPDSKVLFRIETYWAAIGMAIEAETGTIASPLLRLSHEGFGRVVLTAGRLILVSKHLRDVHRFGFDSFADMASKTEALVAEGVGMLKRFPDVADA